MISVHLIVQFQRLWLIRWLIEVESSSYYKLCLIIIFRRLERSKLRTMIKSLHSKHKSKVYWFTKTSSEWSSKKSKDSKTKTIIEMNLNNRINKFNHKYWNYNESNNLIRRKSNKWNNSWIRIKYGMWNRINNMKRLKNRNKV